MNKPAQFFLLLLSLGGVSFGGMQNRQASSQSSSESTMNAETAERFAKLALACVHKEYPNKLAHSLNSDADVAPPRQLTPAFYGCYDWHSSVHGHWLLA